MLTLRREQSALNLWGWDTDNIAIPMKDKSGSCYIAHIFIFSSQLTTS